MSMNFDFELAIVEKEYQLLNQEQMLKKVQLEEMRLQKKLKDYAETKDGLEQAIADTKADLDSLKEGVIPEKTEGGEK